MSIRDEREQLEPLARDELLWATFVETEVSVDRHLAALQRTAFDEAGCLWFPQLRKRGLGTVVRIGGIIAEGVRTPPTANGAGFLRLENVEGIVDVIVPA